MIPACITSHPQCSEQELLYSPVTIDVIVYQIMSYQNCLCWRLGGVTLPRTALSVSYHWYLYDQCIGHMANEYNASEVHSVTSNVQACSHYIPSTQKTILAAVDSAKAVVPQG